MNVDDNIVHGEPTKEFFIDFLTRDISLSSCILDLVDNSIQNLVHISKIDVMQALLIDKSPRFKGNPSVTISFSKDYFRISDTCGGIPIQMARDEMFRMGYAKSGKRFAGLGLYGIGMKRAFFKIGRDINIISRTHNESFLVKIDVDDWKSRSEWDFRFSDPPPSKDGRISGTDIEIKRLNPGIGPRLSLVTFENEIIRKLRSTYALFLRNGLRISVNGRPVTHALPSLATKVFTPTRKRFSESGVDILVIVGLSPKSDNRPHGWYVFCNGRMIIEDDQSDKTGWGQDGTPQFRPKYNHFVGLVYFRSNDLEKLPWTTTKDNVEVESPIYQAALTEMKIEARPVTRFINTWYPSDKDEEEQVVHRLLLDRATITRIDQIPKRIQQFKVSVQPRKVEDVAKISYIVPRASIDRVRKRMGNLDLTNKEVGKRTFDYYLEKEC